MKGVEDFGLLSIWVALGSGRDGDECKSSLVKSISPNKGNIKNSPLGISSPGWRISQRETQEDPERPARGDWEMSGI